MKRKVAISFGLCALWGSSYAGLTSVFDFNGSLSPVYNNGHAADLEFYKGAAYPSPNGMPTFVTQTVGPVNKKVAAFGKTEGFKVYHGVGPNGGGIHANLFTVVMDIKLTEVSGGWASLLQSGAVNNNDGELFYKHGSGIGISGDYANSNPPFALDQWHRVVSTWDLANQTLNVYVDGNFANSVALSSGVDGRWSLYTWQNVDSYQHCWIFMDEDGENGAGYVSLLAFYDEVLSASDVARLGAAGQPVPEPASMALLGLGALGLMARRKKS